MNVTLAGLQQVVSTLTRILITPTSNLKVAFLLYGTIALFLILILIIGLMFVMAAPDDATPLAPSSDRRKDTRSKQTVPPKRRRDSKAAPRGFWPKSPRMRLLLGVGIALALVGVWVVAGITTSDAGFCNGCHSTSVHAKADKGKDPHAKVVCVSCHERGGVIGRYVSGVPFRLLHLAAASVGAGNKTEYGQVTTRACASCHGSSLAGTKSAPKRGLKMSHAEPLAASASCIDCHTMRNGTVSVHNVGMKPCLRCHDGNTASSECVTCHEGTVAAAARARTTSFRGEQIKDVTCGGCHNEKRDCDGCHGLRMPHSTEFKNGGHARAAVVDVWYNGGKTCRRCHTASSRPCTQCHSTLMGKAHGAGMAESHQSGAASSCDTCHRQYATIATRDFCKDLCHSAAAKAASPR